ncbi:MAG: hypothetical protein U0805_13900 [Pirellulales bacterium]
MFVVILAMMGGAIAYVSRPPSADTLYTKISTQVSSDDEGSLTKVESEVDDFLSRFPADPRADELRSYKDRIDLDKLERKLQRESRSSGSINTSLVPAEQLYLEAYGMAAAAPEKAIELLTAIVNLYRDDAPNDPAQLSNGNATKNRDERNVARRTASVVQLAQRRIEILKADLSKQRAQHLAALNERLTAVEALQSTKPDRAAGMYRAIIKLHENDPWAAAIVEKARRELARLEKQ